MGLGFVLIFWFILLSALAVASSKALRHFTLSLLRGKQPGRWLLLSIRALPFACVLYAGAWFVAYASINEAVFHRDSGLGDSWSTSIPAGYAVDFIDVMDLGSVHPAGGQMNELNSPAGVSYVRRFQVALPYFFGSQDSNGFEHLETDNRSEDRFFVIDSRNHTITNFASEVELKQFVERNGKTLRLKPLADVYRDYRFGWFDYTAAGLLLLLPATALLFLGYRVFRLRGAPTSL